MDNQDAEQLLQAILDNAEAEPSEFRFIKSIYDFQYCLRLYKSTKLVIKVLKKASKRLFKTYCKDIVSGTADVTQLLAVDQLKDVIAFYETELKTIDDMLDEYEDYLWKGNFFYAIMGGERY